MVSGHPLVPNHEIHFSFSQLDTLPFQHIFFNALQSARGPQCVTCLKMEFHQSVDEELKYIKEA